MKRVISMKEIILASASPRRKELMSQLHIPFTVQVSGVDEQIEGITTPADIARILALQKAKDIAIKNSDAVVIGADTVVSINGSVLGKPRNEEEAFNMLKQLSGNVHEVYTGVAILQGDEEISFHERTEVVFYPLTDEEILNYIRSGEPMDKAGSYGIQGLGAYFVQKINGDYFSVVGLPVARVKRSLIEQGYL